MNKKKYSLEALMAKRKISKRGETSIVDEIALLSGTQKSSSTRTEKRDLVQEILYALADSFKVYADNFPNNGTEIDAIVNVDDIAEEFKSRLDLLVGVESLDDETLLDQLKDNDIKRLTSLYA